MGHIGMKYSLVTRDLIADSTEAMAMAHQFDALVMVPNCDKNVPGLLMAAARVNVPTVFVSGGGLNRKYGGNTNISLAIKENGVYDFTFADAAGNMTQQQITVDSIDEIPPVVYASGIPETYIRSEDCSVKVTMSEAGTITFRGKEYPVKAPTDKTAMAN